MRTLAGRLALIAATAFAFPALAEKAIPALTGPVIDETGTLSVEQRAQIASELQSFREGAQIQVWMTPSLDGDSIEGTAIRAFDQWKLGSEKGDNGALILIAMTDRRMRIEVGRGLEGAIPDSVAGRIVDSVLAPHFRSGDYYGGLSKASRLLYELGTGRAASEAVPAATPRRRERSAPSGLVILIFFVILLFQMIGGGRRRRRSGVLPFLLGAGLGRSSRGWGGGGGGWSGGGGGWSGGGGSSAGGGASGSW